jgi:hypothetical protein
MHWSWRNEYIETARRKKKLLDLSDSFSIHEWATWHLIESGCASWLCWCCASLLDPLGPVTRVCAHNGKRTFSNSKLDQSLIRSKMIFSCMVEQDGCAKSRVTSYWHGTGNEQHSWVLDRPWRFKCDIRALGRIQEGTHEATTIWLNDICETRSTFGWGWTISKCYFRKSSRDLKQEGKTYVHQVLEKY